MATGFATLFERLATGFSNTHGGPYHDATAHWSGAPTMDSGGSITAPGTPTNASCRVQGDAATEAMRQAEGFLATDVRLLVLGLTALDSAAEIEIDAGPHTGRWALLSVQRDPAGVGFECRGRKIG